MTSVLLYMRETLVSMLAALPLVAGARWLCAIRRKRLGKKVTALHEAGVWIFALCLLGLLSQTIIPELMSLLRGRPGAGSRVNLEIFLVFRQTWDEVFRNGNVSYFFINFLGNILIFAPIGFFPPLLWRRMQRLWKTALFGCGLSVFIELTQLLLPRGTDVDDVWLNTLGAVLGYLLWKVVKKAAPKFAARCACEEG